MHISWSLFLFWGFSGISLHDLQFKKLLIHLILVFYAAPQSSFCLKQAVLAPVSLSSPSLRALSVLIGLSPLEVPLGRLPVVQEPT